METVAGIGKWSQKLTTRLSSRGRRNQISFIVLVAPALVWFLVVMGWPLVNMFHVSTLNWRRVIDPSTFVGLDNFRALFAADKFYISLKNTFIYWVALEAVVMPTSFLLGFFLSQRKRGYRIFRTVFFTPNMLSAPALAMLFLGVFLPDGILNFLLKAVGLNSLAHVWFADTSTALGALVAVDIWGAIGFFSVLFYGALTNLPQELIDASRIDGADLWTIIWKIAFPLTIDIFGVTFMILFLGSLNQAQLSLLLTKGGPGTATYTLGYYLYDMAFQSQKLGYSQAIGVFIFLVGIIGTYIIRRVFRPRT